MPLKILAATAALLAACAARGDRELRRAVEKTAGFDGAWTLPAEPAPVRLDTTGTTATLAWHGRLFVFERFDGFRGWIGNRSVELLGHRRAVRLDVTRLQVVAGDEHRTWPLDELPRGRPIRIDVPRLRLVNEAR